MVVPDARAVRAALPRIVPAHTFGFMALTAGARLGAFEIGGLLGAGGMGAV